MEIKRRKIISPNSDAQAKECFDRLRIQKPLLKISALWKFNHSYFIETSDATPELNDWFDENFRPMCLSLQLTNHPPEGGIKLTERTIEERTVSSGAYRNHEFAAMELQMELPTWFPECAYTNNERTILVEREINEIEFKILEEIVFRVGIPVEVEVIADEAFFRKERKSSGVEESFDFYTPLATSKSLALSKFSSELKKIIRSDEEIWIEKRKSVFEPSNLVPKDLLPKYWDLNKSRCLISTDIHSPGEVRSLISQYQVVTLVLPTNNQIDIALNGLGITKQELIELVRIGRLQLLVTKSPELYDIRILEEVASVAPDSILFSRRLGLVTLLDSRRRFPLLFPPLSVAEMREILYALELLGANVPSEFRNQYNAITSSLKNNWEHFDSTLPFQGVQSGVFGGLGKIISSVINQSDTLIELETSLSALNIQMSSTFHAHYIPFQSAGEKPHIDQILAPIIASIYSGMPLSGDHEFIDRTRSLVSGILPMTNNIPVLEIANAFAGSDIDRFRALIHTMAKYNTTPEDLEQTIKGFNNEVKKFVGRDKFTNFYDVAGVLISLNSNAIIPPTGWLIWFLEDFLQKYMDSSLFGSVLDTFKGITTLTPANAVLINRMRNKLKDPF